MLLDNYKKESPIVGVAGLGGGINSYIFLSSDDTPYVISKSLRFNDDDSAYLTRTPSSASDRQKWTWAAWVKKTSLTTNNTLFSADASNSDFVTIRFESDTIRFDCQGDGQSRVQVTTAAVYRDPSAWYHIVIALDTTQGTSADRCKIYINNILQTTSNTITQNKNFVVNSTVNHEIGRRSDGNDHYFDGYLADIHLVDGQQLAPTDFGRTDSAGVWQPKKFSGSHGTNGFHLDFKDNSSDAALGYDAAGSNNFTVNNLTAPSAVSKAIDLDGNDQIEYPGPGDGISGDFTMECFFLMDSSASGYQRIFSTKEDSYSDEQTIIRRHTNGKIQWYCGNSSPSDHEGPTITSGVWHHVALVRSGSTVSYYYDGSRLSTDTYNTSFDITKLVVGGGYGSEQFNGDVHGARFTLGQALYSGSSYTVPTSAITTTSQGATASNVKVLAGTTSTVNENVGTLGNGTNSGNPTAITAYPFGSPADIDSLIDSPSQSVADETDTGLGGQITGNYATYNPVRVGSGTKSNGNLTVTGTGQVPDVTSIAPNSGKWYAEIKWDSGTYARIGLQDVNIPTSDFGGVNGQSYRYESNSGNVQPGGQTYSTYTAGDIIGIAFDCDAGKLWLAKNGTWQNSGDPAAGSGAVATNLVSGSYYAPASSSGSGSSVFTLNAGQRAFEYAAPTGFKCLTVENLSTPTIADGSKYFDVATDTGANILAAATAKTDNAGFVWIKDRDNNSTNHIIFNKVNDVGMDGTPHMRSNETDNETTCGTYSAPSGNSVGWVWDAGDAANPTTIAPGGLNSSAYDDSQTWSGMCSPTPSSGTFANGFDGSLTTTFAGGISAGAYFTFTPTGGISFSNNIRVYNGAVSGASYKYNGGSATSFPTNSWTTVASGGGTMTTFAVTRSDTDVHGWYAIEVDGKILVDDGASPPNVPSIGSTIKANQTAGFSICTYSGSGSNGTWGHGLLTAPDLIIVKCRNVAQNWAVQHSALGPTQYAYLNTTNNFRTSSGTAFWNDTAPTNTTVSVGTDNDTNSSGKTYVAYSFSTIPGYSSFGKYTGNGNADGIYIYTGFSPRWLLFKRSDSTSDWSIYDTARDPHNVAGDKLEPNASTDEDEQGTVIDILSNGFKFRRNSLENGGNDVYVYAAFASHPFNTSRAR